MAFLNSLTNLLAKTLPRRFGQDTTTQPTNGGGSWYEPMKPSSLFSVSRPENLKTGGFQVPNANPNISGIALNKVSGPVQGPIAPNSTPSPSIQQIKLPAATAAQTATQPPTPTPFLGQPANQAQLSALSQAALPKPPAPVDMSGFVSTDIDTQNRLSEMQAQALANSTKANDVATSPVTTMPVQTGPATMPAQTGLSDLEKAYLASFNMTPEEKAQQAQLNAIIAQQANLSASEELGLNKIKDQAIAMPFVTGQSASLQRSVAGQMGALEAQGTPLVNQLAMAQANRQSMADRAKAELEIIKNQQAALKPTTTEVGGTLIQYNPATGQYTEVYRSPGEAAKPIALGEGQILVDPVTGERIASGLPKTTTAEFGKTQIVNGEMYQQDPISGAWSKVDLGNAPSAAKIETAQSVVALAQSILNDNKFNAVFGPISSRIPTMSGETATLEANIERLKSLLTIENMGIMKGVLSDSDMRVLSSAAAALNTGMGEAGAKKEIKRIITDMQDRISKAGQSGGGNSDSLGLGFNNASGQALNSPIGSLSEKFESGGNPGAIGYDRTGGLSYGNYQLAYSNAKNFVDNSQYKNAFAGIPFNSTAWQNKWKEVAQKDPIGFANAQKHYIKNNYFEPQVKKIQSASNININTLPTAIKDVIWSTAVQHGANTNIITQAIARANPITNPEGFIKAVYDLRWSGGKNFASSTQQVRNSVYNRFYGANGELATALSMLKNA